MRLYEKFSGLPDMYFSDVITPQTQHSLGVKNERLFTQFLAEIVQHVFFVCIVVCLLFF